MKGLSKMANYYCHRHPDVLDVETRVMESRPGQVVLDASPFHPGGGGQLCDRGWLRWGTREAPVIGFEHEGDKIWLRFEGDEVPDGLVQASVDPDFRRMMSELHTATHVLNALVFQAFDGALVTSAQLNDDNTARMDFDLPDADNERLRALEADINAALRRDLPVTYQYLPLAEAQAVHGLVRSKSVAPPPDADGLVRIVVIEDLDRQACGGTHLASIGQCPPVRIVKVENKGRHNRRIKIALERL